MACPGVFTLLPGVLHGYTLELCDTPCIDLTNTTASPRMFRLQYRSNYEDALSLQRLECGDIRTTLRQQTYFHAIKRATPFAVAVVVSYYAENEVLVFLFLAFLLWALKGEIVKVHELREQASEGVYSEQEREIDLVINDKGMVETVADVVSFAPWSSVISWTVFEDRVFIELASYQWAIVPKERLESADETWDKLQRTLEQLGIRKRAEQDWS